METKNLIISTPEGISFNLDIAGPISRFLALLIDLGCISVLSIVFNTILSLLSIINQDLSSALMIISFFVLQIGYGILMEWKKDGQTIGKRILKIKVIDQQALEIKFSQILIRNLFRFIDSIPFFYLIGGIIVYFSSKNQRLGDYIANTVVIRIRDINQPDLNLISSEKYNSFKDYPYLIARVRQKITQVEIEVALQAILRRNEISAEKRVDIFKELARNFQEKVSFPLELIENISNEQYVKNILEVLYKSK